MLLAEYGYVWGFVVLVVTLVLFCVCVCVCVCVCTCICMQVCSEARRSLELEKIVKTQHWVLGANLKSFARAASILTPKSPSPGPSLPTFLIDYLIAVNLLLCRYFTKSIIIDYKEYFY